MLTLNEIRKDYRSGDSVVHALNGVSLRFRRNEFVSILGQSGCGKTTLLNIIGGLDQYTSGDLIINGKSTKDFRDGDWDVYRNRAIGFVFQSYNLIPHQTVLRNVELAMTLSGVSRAERRRRAIEALEKVGLGDQLKKKPNQMSGGQMQRVAIARALVNNPDIILADEPTGALDTETSVQVMELLKEVAQDRLVIMVTHNPELAERYSTRIVRLLDGSVIGDTNPYDGAEEADEVKAPARIRKKPMTIRTATSLSLNNLMTKKTRTLLTAFAGSIGIIGIALILSLSNGIQGYIDRVQEETLSSYPITIEAESVDMSSMLLSFMGANAPDEDAAPHEEDRVYSSNVMYNMLDSMVNAEVQTNNLRAFKEYLDNDSEIASLATLHYSYDFDFNFYTEDADGNIIKSDVIDMMQTAMGALYGGDYSSYFDTMGSMYSSMDVWEELLPGEDGALVSDMVQSQYDLLYGTWPQSADEVILFVSDNNEISDLMLYSLGLISANEMTGTLTAMMDGETVEAEQLSWSYEELCQRTFKLILPAEYYQRDTATGGYVDLSQTDTGMDYLYNSDSVGTTIRVVGIARPNADATSTMVSGAIGYTSALTQYAIEQTAQMPVVLEQQADETTDVFSGLPFATGDEPEPTDEEKAEAISDYLLGLTGMEQATAYLDAMSQPSSEYLDAVTQQQLAGVTRAELEEQITAQYAAEMGVDTETVASYIAQMEDDELFAMVGEAIAEQVRAQYAEGVQAQLGAMTTDQLSAALTLALTGADGVEPLTAEQYDYLYDNYMPATLSDGSFDENMDKLGYLDLDSPSSINIYCASFADKDTIADLIDAYNDSVSEDDQITYTDYVALLMSSITTIINAISYVLIAFVAISLIVSSIMIGIITYISVLERTKEIGILRAIGASKKDIARVFNAETVIEGFVSGAIGILLTLLLILPINVIIRRLSGIEALGASLPVAAAVILVLISMALTVIAGLIPSRIAARKDPVEALRTE
jgi:putative ABC transport system permease protein